MSKQNLIAKAEIDIQASAEKVWKALTDPEIIKKYMMGAVVNTDWKPGSPITWQGEWKGKKYEDKGVIQIFEPATRLQYTHFSPLTGAADLPENYHTVSLELTAKGDATRVLLTQDKNETEEAKQHSQKNWQAMLDGLKKLVKPS